MHDLNLVLTFWSSYFSYDVIKSKDEIIMVIEFAGKELFDYIVQQGRMTEDEARRFFQQIISAVEYCHRHKIVHRDLKPENLLLDENLNVKIADFGLSNIMTDGNFLKTSCGSPNYAAPEVISGKLYAGPEVDVWSCGVILYVMLCGRLPFDDEFIPNLFKKISGGVYSIPRDLSAGSKHLLQRMLVVNPLNRITVHEIMEDPWFKVGIDPSLLPPDMQSEQHAPDDAIDDSLVGALGRTMGYAKEQVYDALRQTNGEGSEIRDAYQLMKDNRLLGKDAIRQGEMDRYLEEDSSTEDSKRRAELQATNSPKISSGSRPVSANFGRDNPPTLTFDRIHGSSMMMESGIHKTPSNTIAVLPTSLPAYHRANMIAYGPPTMRKLNPVSTKKSKTRWHFGIRSRSYPLDVMGEIYRALKNLGAEWATPSDDDLWTIHVRWNCKLPTSQPSNRTPSSPNAMDISSTTPPASSETQDVSMSNDDTQTESDSSPKAECEQMKMRIQLYQIEQNNYLVDFKFDGWEDQPAPDGETSVDDSTSITESGNTRVSQSNGGNTTTNNKKRNRSEFDTFSAYPFLHLATRLIMELAVNSQTA